MFYGKIGEGGGGKGVIWLEKPSQSKVRISLVVTRNFKFCKLFHANYYGN